MTKIQNLKHEYNLQEGTLQFGVIVRLSIGHTI